MKKVSIYDTTLRDGTQGEGISFSAEDKLKVALKLDRMGIQYIEGGWPGSNPKDMEFFQRIREVKLEQATIVAFGSTRKPGGKPSEDSSIEALLKSGVKAAAIFGKSWDFHVTHALKTTLKENLRMISDTISYLKEKGLEVIYDGEHFFDGYKNNPDYAIETILAAQDAGADLICLCDTNGGSLPADVMDVVGKVISAVKIPVGIHTHNDGELAVANSLMAVRAGAVQVQGTINGLGERCGNANLCSVIPNLALKMGYQCIPKDKLEGLTELSRYVSELANVIPNSHQPYVGNSAFAHKGGIHVNAMLKHPETYEHIKPETVGNSRRVLVSELSGMSNIVYKAEELNLDIDLRRTNPETKAVLDEIKELEHKGFQFEGAEASFELLLRKAFNGYHVPFKLDTLRIIMEKREESDVYSEAIIKMKVGQEIVHTAAEGNGPVNAMDNALRKALEGFYPEIHQMQLADYKVRVLDGNAGTGALVRVLIETHDKHESWGTVGVSENIIEASWQAMVDSLEYGLYKSKKKNKEA
ncbi:citramalate synthase [Phosphitispora sp. TUW77]|uniref:citramalate synthase n=1 Tax=Phosphitispora sp. TUW77 TaxID=3152361 RepID=UPI003AB1BFDB